MEYKLPYAYITNMYAYILMNNFFICVIIYLHELMNRIGKVFNLIIDELFTHRHFLEITLTLFVFSKNIVGKILTSGFIYFYFSSPHLMGKQKNLGMMKMKK